MRTIVNAGEIVIKVGYEIGAQAVPASDHIEIVELPRWHPMDHSPPSCSCRSAGDWRSRGAQTGQFELDPRAMSVRGPGCAHAATVGLGDRFDDREP